MTERRPNNDTVFKMYYDPQYQQYPAKGVLIHQPIKLLSGNNHDLQSLSTLSASHNKTSHRSMNMNYDFNMSDEEKRQQALEKNRLAAFKCRQRKKAWVEELTKKSDEAIHQNTSLKRQIKELKEDVLFLKSQLLAHRGCQCQIINNYIKQHMINGFQKYESNQLSSSDQPIVQCRHNIYSDKTIT